MAEVTIKKDKCKGCYLCILYCPTKHLTISSQLNKRGVSFAALKEGTRCAGCGFCFLVCPESCIEVYDQNLKE
jgi:2-oxoglutarate ferredoxin oxidoreductase subunit delta